MNKVKLVFLCLVVCFCVTAALNSIAEEVTRGEYIKNIAMILGLDSDLPADFTPKDCALVLNEKGFDIKNTDKLNAPITSAEKSDLNKKLFDIRWTERKKPLEGIATKAIADEIRGDVTAKLEGTKKWIKVTEEMQFDPGDIFKTGPDSYVKLRVGKFGRIIIRENSELSLKELKYRKAKNAENIILNLAEGEAIIDVRDINPESRFEVRTSSTLAAVRGTIYSAKIVNGGDFTTLEAAEEK